MRSSGTLDDMQPKRFSPRTIEALGHYVYLYIDPRTNTPFYIGKGKGNRVFAHAKDLTESEKAKRIREIRKSGSEPIIEILKHGLTDDEAKLVESTAIDLMDVKNLTNLVRGHGSKHGARAGIEEVEATLNPKSITITHPALLINISRAFRYGMTPIELYDVTRSAWKLSSVGGRREKVEIALSIYRGVVREVYQVNAWVRGGDSMHSSNMNGRPVQRPDRWEFIGHVADDAIRNKYLNRSVSAYFPPGNQNPIKYVCCD